MELLKVKLNDTVYIADGQFRVAGVIAHDSNQELGFSGFSPTVIINQNDVAKPMPFRWVVGSNTGCSLQAAQIRPNALQMNLSICNKRTAAVHSKQILKVQPPCAYVMPRKVILVWSNRLKI